MATGSRIHPVILSGGAGTRLWPVSRAIFPKQLMPLTGEQSLLQETAARVSDPARFAAPLVICNEDHRFMVAEQLQRVGLTTAAIMLEPAARNTAPATCVAALQLLEADPEALMLLLPSDHFIADRAGFLAAVEEAAAAAAEGWLVTFGITPDRPETGYGYIDRAEPLAEGSRCHRVARFVEKPDVATAEGYLAAGTFAWNSGMFLFSAARLVEEIARFAPEILTACRQALGAKRHDLDFLRLGEEAFKASPSISIDYAVMEKAERCAVVPVDIGWTDVGSWSALWEIAGQDEAANGLSGDVVAIDTKGSYLRSEGPLIATVGVEDLVVVATGDAVLVCPKDRAQDTKKIVERLDSKARDEHLLHKKVFRPWGAYEGLDEGEGFQVKRLTINPGASLSLQRHRHRAEHWVVVQGTAEVTRDDEVFTLGENQSTYIPVGAVHRLRNPGDKPLHIVEVQSGAYLGEDDIERFEDNYGRTGTTD